MSLTFVLITGENRALGRGLVKRFFRQPSHSIIVANRDPTHPSSRFLTELLKCKDSALIVVKYDTPVEQDAFNAVSELTGKHGIDRLGIIIRNTRIFL